MLCFTYLQMYTEWGAFTSILYFISGLGICVTAMVFAVKGHKIFQPVPATKNIAALIIKIVAATSFLIFISILLLQFGNHVFAVSPIDYRVADMLPLLQTACQRWLNHQPVYTPVNEVWGGENIPYLPAMWMPFAPALLCNIDIRWTSLILTSITAVILLAGLMRIKGKSLMVLAPVFLLSIFMMVKFYTWEEGGLFGLSEEAIPTFYYILLFGALMYENDWFIGIALTLCTLSRFSLLPFIPFFFLWLLIAGRAKRAFKIGAVYGVLMCAIFIIPFFIQQPEYFLNIPGNYTKHLESFWAAYGHNLVGNRGLGLAYVFGYGYHQLMATISVILLILIPAIWLALFVILKKRYTIYENIWAIAGLKLTLVVFYNFISMPFLYIFEVPTLVSLVLLLAIARETELIKLKPE